MFRRCLFCWPPGGPAPARAAGPRGGQGVAGLRSSRDQDRKIAGCTKVLARGATESETNRVNAMSIAAMPTQARLRRAIEDSTRRSASIPSRACLNARARAYYLKGDQPRHQGYGRGHPPDPQYALAYSGRGKAYHGKGDNDRAIKDLDEAIRLDPKIADAYSYRGCLRRQGRSRQRHPGSRRGDPPRSEICGTISIAGWPTRASPIDRAIKDYSQAIRLDARNASAYLHRGGAYFLKGDHDRAIKDYGAAIPSIRNTRSRMRFVAGL